MCIMSASPVNRQTIAKPNICDSTHMKISSRIRAVIHILQTIDNSAIPADRVVSHWNAHNRYAGAKDKNFIARVVYDILRNRMACVWWCEKYNTPVTPYTLVLVYIYFCHTDSVQDAFFDSQNPFSPPPLNKAQHRLYKKLHAHVGLYRDDMPDFVYCNVQQWMYPLFETVYGDDTKAVLLSLNQQAPVDIRVNTLKATVQQVTAALHTQGIKTCPIYGLPHGLRVQNRHNLSALPAFKQGWFEMQDASSQRASKLVDARRGDKIVDFCAGAGGKALAIAQDLDNTGRIICCDVSENRLKRAKIRLKRAGVHNAECRPLTSETDKWIKRRSHRFDGGFDKVVVDAPCTGTGTWRRNPDQKWRITKQDIQQLTALQRRILQSASRLVVGGGRLIYMTCSLLQQENEQQVQTFLQHNRQFEWVDIRNIWQDVFTDMPVPQNGKNYGKSLRFRPQTAPYNTAQPSYDGDGFFIAIMVRKRV